MQVVAAGKAIKMLQPQMVVCPGVQRLKTGHLCAAGLVERNIDLKRRNKMRHDPAAQIVDAIQRGHQTITPDHFIAAAVGQLKRHGKPAISGLDIPDKI